MTAPLVVSGQVVGVAEVTLDLRAARNDRRERIARAVRISGIKLTNLVKSKKLTGQVLNVRTGRLRSSINERFVDAGEEMTSTVGTAVPYGRFWELGFSGEQNVRAFVRGVKQRKDWSRISAKRGELPAGVSVVRSHTRTVNQPARPFLRPALDEIRGDVIAALTKAAGGEG